MHLPETPRLGRVILQAVNRHPHRHGLLLRAGTIVDANLISSRE